MGATAELVVRQARIVPLGGPGLGPFASPTAAARAELVDVRVRGGRVVSVEPSTADPAGSRMAPQSSGSLTAPVRIIDAGGRWLVPGLWDQHVHFTQWSVTAARLDTSGTSCAEDVLARVQGRLAAMGPVGSGGAASSGGGAGAGAGRGSGAGSGGTAYPVVQGFGHRTATWPRQPTVTELDAISGEYAVVLISGDAHHGWLNTKALALLGVPWRDTVLAEDEWFAVFERLAALPGASEAAEIAVRQAVMAAHARGIVGIGDMEWDANEITWPRRWEAGLRSLRVRTAVYPERLDAVVAAGVRTGDHLVAESDRLTMGPLKVITDGSLNTRTAWCCEPYADALGGERGTPNIAGADLAELLGRATAAGLDVAVHAIGDAAMDSALTAIERVGARGSIEHAQLVSAADPARMARLGIAASVQPAHLWDDRDVTMQCWPDRSDRVYAFRSVLDAGVMLALGSDAPVSPLDPWLAIAAAVHRTADARPPWHPEQALSAREALAASVDGQGTVRVGSRGDVVLVDADPLGGDPGDVAGHTAYLRGMPCALTIVGGEVVWSDGVIA
ncbi:MAG: amidohydrolase family protein [Dermatophilaceae bacterium]|nr:amidohydrolase family protein [Dermatophilaceae bacterium]